MREFARCARRSKRALGAGIVAGARVRGVARVAARGCRDRPRDVDVGDRAVPVPAGPAPARPRRRSRAAPVADVAPWVEPDADGSVPGDASGEGASSRAASTTCPAARNYDRTQARPLLRRRGRRRRRRPAPVQALTRTLDRRQPSARQPRSIARADCTPGSARDLRRRPRAGPACRSRSPSARPRRSGSGRHPCRRC